MKNIHTILIANRGEIASRIIRTCRKMGITSAVVYTDADANLPFVRQADLAIHIGEPEPAKSYLDQDKIIAAAKRVNADAIHPGYGFLSENAGFARRCADEEIIFIGPNPEAIEAMGSKSQAKGIMEKAGVPTIPGYKGDGQSLVKLSEEARAVGFPLLLKAVAGGGGKGMRIVRSESEIQSSIEAAKREAQSAFGDDTLLIEKYIESGRHIEFQIFGDQHGKVIHLLERECTIQRRYQKVIEESPSPVMNEELRAKMGEAAVKAAQTLNYDNAGTVEFIYDETTRNYYFLEVNTRLQVEHPVTEAITGLDLVQMQIESAKGMPLNISQSDISGNGYAIEARLYAEDPSQNFTPVTGKIYQFRYPEVEGLRMETAIESGSEISVYYDPMIAKIVIWGENRQLAHQKLRYVLQQMVCQGPVTNQQFLLTLLAEEDFQTGQYDTHFIDQKMNLETLNTFPLNHRDELAIAGTLYNWHQREQKRVLLRGIPSGWRSSFYKPQMETFEIGEAVVGLTYRYQNEQFQIGIEENEYQASIIGADHNQLRLTIDGLQRDFSILTQENDCFIHSPHIGNIKIHRKPRFPVAEKEKVKGGYESPMPAQIIRIHIRIGDHVKAGDPLLVISSMKMETTITAEEEGKVEEIYTSEGSNVEAGFLLLKIS